MSQTAIVTLVVGDEYERLWKTYCEENWRKYARRHGMDVCVLNRAIDQSTLAKSRSVAWQKLLIGNVEELNGYEYLVWIDADIAINDELAPNIVDGVAPNKIGAVRYHPLLGQELLSNPHKTHCRGLGLQELTDAAYRQQGFVALNSRGVTAVRACLLNTGVLVVPRSMTGLLSSTYDKYKDEVGQMAEQVDLSFEIWTRDALHLLNDKFNAVWYEYKAGFYPDSRFDKLAAKWVLSKVYFLHFAGNANNLHLLGATSDHFSFSHDGQ